MWWTLCCQVSRDFKGSTRNSWPNFRNEFPKSQQEKTFVKIYIPETLAFRSTAQQSVELGALRFYLWGTITNPSEFNSNSKLRDASARQL